MKKNNLDIRMEGGILKFDGKEAYKAIEDKRIVDYINTMEKFLKELSVLVEKYNLKPTRLCGKILGFSIKNPDDVE